MVTTITNAEIPKMLDVLKSAVPGLKLDFEQALLPKLKITMSLDIQYESQPGEVEYFSLHIT